MAVHEKNPFLLAYLTHKDEIDSAIHRVLDSGLYLQGSEVRSFEEEFSRYLDIAYATAVGNGTDAITIALKSCGIGPGDEVITVSHTAVATVAAIELTGAVPVLVDINPDTFTLDPELIEGSITRKTKAVLPVHLYGHPADMNRILRIANIHGLHVVEDCAQSHGALLNKRKTGSFGDIATFSFYPTKNLGAMGDGGMVVTRSPELAERVKLLHQYGWKERDHSIIPGMNSRMDEIQAAILRIRLKYLDQENSIRRSFAEIYSKNLTECEVILPEERADAYHVYHQYVIKTVKRDSLKNYLAEHDQKTQIHYPVPVHLQPAYLNRLQSRRLSQTELICSQILSLPMHPFIEKTVIEEICDLIREYFGTV